MPSYAARGAARDEDDYSEMVSFGYDQDTDYAVPARAWGAPARRGAGTPDYEAEVLNCTRPAPPRRAEVD
jgi:hypothetical protein